VLFQRELWPKVPQDINCDELIDISPSSLAAVSAWGSFRRQLFFFAVQADVHDGPGLALSNVAKHRDVSTAIAVVRRLRLLCPLRAPQERAIRTLLDLGDFHRAPQGVHWNGRAESDSLWFEEDQQSALERRSGRGLLFKLRTGAMMSWPGQDFVALAREGKRLERLWRFAVARADRRGTFRSVEFRETVRKKKPPPSHMVLPGGTDIRIVENLVTGRGRNTPADL